MSKEHIIQSLVQQLSEIQQTLVTSALEAKEAATSEESKAENKYDTRGLEASYLAGAQAKRAGELTQSINQLKTLQLKTFERQDSIEVTALIEVEVDGEFTKKFFLLPSAGGTKIHTEEEEIIVITPTSPIGRLMLGKKVGDFFEFTSQSKVSEYEIAALQ